MSNHTPGPWIIQNEQGDNPYIVSEQGKVGLNALLQSSPR